MPHPSKLTLPEWLDSNEKWKSIILNCDHPIKFSLLASDLHRNKLFQSTDHFWIVLYLLSEDIQQLHGIDIISELHCYRDIAFQIPYHFEKKKVSEKLFSLFDNVVNIEGNAEAKFLSQRK